MIYGATEPLTCPPFPSSSVRLCCLVVPKSSAPHLSPESQSHVPTYPCPRKARKFCTVCDGEYEDSNSGGTFFQPLFMRLERSSSSKKKKANKNKGKTFRGERCKCGCMATWINDVCAPGHLYFLSPQFAHCSEFRKIN